MTDWWHGVMMEFNNFIYHAIKCEEFDNNGTISRIIGFLTMLYTLLTFLNEGIPMNKCKK